MGCPRLVHVISKILTHYLGFVAITSLFDVQNQEHFQNNIIVGFWHGDSLTMQLLLRKLSGQFKGIKVIITTDARGSYIEGLLKVYGAEAVRMPDGLRIRHFLEALQRIGKDEGILAGALDGPTGPIHCPKKLLFKLAETAQKEVVCVSFHYSRVLRLWKRWDKYAIPLPFSSITVKSEVLSFKKEGDGHDLSRADCRRRQRNS